MTFDYLKWIEAQKDPAYTIRRDSENQVTLRSENAIGTVKIYHLEKEIVTLEIVRTADDKNVFFLHFELADPDQAKELFLEMAASLKKQKADHKVMILLSCTSGMTTSYFAEKLNEAANVLSLSYEFNAVSYDRLIEKGIDYDVILLAPQISFRKKEIENIFHRQIILQIPPQSFGTYNTGEVIDLVKEELKKRRENVQERAIAKLARDIKNNAKLLVLSMVHDVRSASYAIRVYDKGNIIYDQSVVREDMSIDAIDELLTIPLRTITGIDAIGIAIPGIFGHEKKEILNYNYKGMALHMRQKFNLPAYAINNTDCAALGLYASQDKYDLITYHSQPLNSIFGGQGMVSWGHLIRGKDDVAGEVNMLRDILNPHQKMDTDHAFTYDVAAVRTSIIRSLIINIAMFNPEVIYLRSPGTTDTEEIVKGIRKYISDAYIPDVILIKDVSEVTLLGIMLMTLHELQKEKTGQLKMQAPDAAIRTERKIPDI